MRSARVARNLVAPAGAGIAPTVDGVEPTVGEGGAAGPDGAAEPRGVTDPGDDVRDDDVQAPNAAAAIRPEPARRKVRRVKSLWDMAFVGSDLTVRSAGGGRDSRRAPSPRSGEIVRHASAGRSAVRRATTPPVITDDTGIAGDRRTASVDSSWP
jgi:hypothetical protein